MNSKLYSILEKVEAVVHALLMLLGACTRRRSLGVPVSKKKVFISRPDSIGDFVLFSAALKDYRELFKDAYIVLLVSSEVYELAINCPFVDEVWGIDVRKFRLNPIHKLRWFKRVRERGFDISVYPVFSLGFTYLEPLVGWTNAPIRVAHACFESKRKRKTRPYFTALVPMSRSWMHELERNEMMLRYLGFRGETNKSTAIWLPESTGLSSFSIPKPYAVVVPGARDPLREWGTENFAQMIERMIDRCNLHWIALGSRTDKAKCDQVGAMMSRGSDRYFNLAGKTTLPEAVQIIHHACIVVGNESGLLHIANALGVPSVVIVGGGHFGRFFPYPYSTRERLVYEKLDCYYCNWQCRYDRRVCISNISVEAVYTAVCSAYVEIGVGEGLKQ